MQFHFSPVKTAIFALAGVLLLSTAVPAQDVPSDTPADSAAVPDQMPADPQDQSSGEGGAVSGGTISQAPEPAPAEPAAQKEKAPPKPMGRDAITGEAVPLDNYNRRGPEKESARDRVRARMKD